MKCECCGKEIEGAYVHYLPKDKYFCRHNAEECFKEWLYDQTDGDCEYGVVGDEDKEVLPSWTEEYLNTLGMSMSDF